LSVMKPYLMTIFILSILVHKTSGKSSYSQRFWGPAYDQGLCRKKCRTYEVELHYCANGKKCCMKSYSTMLSHVVEENINWSKFIVTTRTGTLIYSL
uniref:Beta-defensin n=1 Tax=Balaenoptera musculus TaxID=9771 RepID=A0A8C0DCR5_BALMU